MTVAMLMENTFLASLRQWEQARNRKVKPLALNMLEKVPSDIDIAMAQNPKPVAELATEVGVLPNELESYGKYKAKVDLSILGRLAHRKDGKYIIVSGCAFLPWEVVANADMSQMQHHTNTFRGGEIHHNHWVGTSPRSRTRSSSICLRPAT